MLEPQFPQLNQATLPCGDPRMALTTTGVDAWRIVESDDSAPKVSNPSCDREVLMRSAKVYKHATLPPLGCLLIATSNHRSRHWHIHKEDDQHVFNPGCYCRWSCAKDWCLQGAETKPIPPWAVRCKLISSLVYPALN